MTIIAVWMLMDVPGLGAIAQQLVHDRPAMFLLSLMFLISGLAVVLGHQVWAGGIAPVLVTLAGRLLLARGMLLLFLPPTLLEALVDAFLGPLWLYPAGVAAPGSGPILTYAGFRPAPIVPREQ